MNTSLTLAVSEPAQHGRRPGSRRRRRRPGPTRTMLASCSSSSRARRTASADPQEGHLAAPAVQLGPGLSLDLLEVGVSLAEQADRDLVVPEHEAVHRFWRRRSPVSGEPVIQRQTQIAWASARFNAWPAGYSGPAPRHAMPVLCSPAPWPTPTFSSCPSSEPLPGKQTGAEVGKLVALMQRLLAEDGCPWDREQTLRDPDPLPHRGDLRGHRRPPRGQPRRPPRGAGRPAAADGLSGRAAPPGRPLRHRRRGPGDRDQAGAAPPPRLRRREGREQRAGPGQLGQAEGRGESASGDARARSMASPAAPPP